MFRDAADWFVIGCGAIGAAILFGVVAYAQPPQNGGGGPRDGSQSVYQRQSNNDWRWDKNDRRRDNRWQQQWQTPQTSSSWFQRPYPYHLDYYKMKWGGTYAPYFGNLYGTPFGTPQVVNGGWGPGPSGVPPQGFDGPGGNQGGFPPGMMMSAPGQDAGSMNPSNQSEQQQPTNESLPAPVK